MKRRFLTGAIVVFLALALTAGAFGGCSLRKEADKSRELASVNSSKITENALNTRVNIFKIFYGPSVESADTKEKILDQLVEEALLVQEAARLKVKVSQDEVNKEFEEFRKTLENQFGSKEKMDTEIANLKLSMDDLRAFIERYLVLQAVYKKVTEKIDVPVEDMQKYYEEHKDDFKEEESVQARHILVSKKEDAEKILAELKAGADFVELAKKYSQDPGSKDNGGDLGKFGRHDMVEEFGKVAFSLAPGTISDIVKTDFGYHIIRVEAKYPEKQLTFDEVKDQIKEIMLEEKRSQEFDKYLKDLQAKAKINRSKI